MALRRGTCPMCGGTTTENVKQGLMICDYCAAKSPIPQSSTPTPPPAPDPTSTPTPPLPTPPATPSAPPSRNPIKRAFSSLGKNSGTAGCGCFSKSAFFRFWIHIIIMGVCAFINPSLAAAYLIILVVIKVIINKARR